MGDSNIIHCLTGWLPEPIPLKYGLSQEIWQLLLDILPNWKLPNPPIDSESKLAEKDSKPGPEEEIKKEETMKPEVKENKDGKEAKGKKEDKEGKEVAVKEKTEKVKPDKQKDKTQDRMDKDGKSKDKGE